MKQKLKKADEYDVICSQGAWRRWYCYLQRTGAVSKVKTRLRRRARHEARHDIRKGNW